MTRVQNLNIDPDVYDLMIKGVKIRNEYGDPRIDKKNIVWRKRNFKELDQQSVLDPVARLWNDLSYFRKQKWANSGAVCNLTGYRLFVQDTGFRVENNISGIANPRLDYQFKVLEFDSGDDCIEFHIYQDHPSNYTIKQRIEGKKNAYKEVDIEEIVSSSLLVEFWYYANLEQFDTDEVFEIIIWFYGFKNGSPDFDVFVVSLNPQTGWIQFSQEFTPDLDSIDYYYIEIWALNYTGIFRMDNLNLFHDSQNWAFDSRFDKMDLKHWDYGFGFYYPYVLDWGGTYNYFGMVYLY